MTVDDTTELTGPPDRCARCGEPVAGDSELCTRCRDTEPRVPRGERSEPRHVGPYRIVREIGSGGMGSVFEAYDEKLRRTVAIKLLSGHLALSRDAGQRFENEAWIAGKLDHPNIVKVFDRGTSADVDYYTMELVTGGSLHDVIDSMKRRRRDDRLGLEFGSRGYVHWAIVQTITAARALDYAHRHRVVHRDVKPLNILFSEEHKTVKLADFGLAFETDAARLTRSGRVMGTLPYMAPEQLMGKSSEIDARADIYALGVTLFELLTLHYPYEADSAELYVNAALTAPVQRARRLNERVGRDLETVLGKALEKRPVDRYATAAELADDLDAVLNLRPIRARPPGTAERLWKWARRKPVHAALLAVLVVAVPSVSVLARAAWASRQAAARARVETLWSEIRYLHQRSRYEELMHAATELLALDPAHDRALRSRAIAGVELGAATEDPEKKRRFVDGALADVDAIGKLLPDASWPVALRQYVLTRSGRAPSGAFVSPAPGGSADEMTIAAWLARDGGDPARAAELLTKVIALSPGNADAYADRGDAYERLDRRDEAAADYRIAAGLNPDDVYHPLRLARLLTIMGKLDEAETQARRALALVPDHALALESLSHVLLEKGRKAVSAGDTATASDAFVQAEKAARTSLMKQQDGNWALVNLGASLSEKNRLLASPDAALLREAEGCFERALARWGGVPAGDDRAVYMSALGNSCDALTQMKNFGSALEVCERVTRLDPRSAVAFYNLAGVNALLGRRDEALSALEKDLELGDKDWQYLSSDRWFESLRTDPKFAAIVARMRAAADR